MPMVWKLCGPFVYLLQVHDQDHEAPGPHDIRNDRYRKEDFTAGNFHVIFSPKLLEDNSVIQSSGSNSKSIKSEIRLLKTFKTSFLY